MGPSDIAAIAAGVTGVIVAGFGALRWIVKAYLHELVPNGGSSMADRINRIETAQTRIHERIDMIYDHLVTNR